jgi:hypothetical protein
MAGKDFLNFRNVPMSVEDIRHWMQDFFGKPVAIRKQGSQTYKCPYCKQVHRCKTGPGHVQADCKTKNSGGDMVIGDRYFSAAYGVKVVQYV